MFRKILVPLAGVDSDSAAIDAALLLGREFEAFVEALYAKKARDEHSVGDTIERAGFIEIGRVRALFLNRCKSYGIEELGDKTTDRLSADFLELQGIEADLIAEHGRLSDLIVFAHPNSRLTSRGLIFRSRLRFERQPGPFFSCLVRSPGSASAM